jgi:phosphoribosyl-ATP pyrophosphohydrolase
MTFSNKLPARVNSPRFRPRSLPPEKVIVTTPATPSIFQQLMDVIADRKAHPPQRSYTTSLFAGGVEKIGAKIEEEAAEVIEAAGETGEEGRKHLIREAADLVYHLFVMLGYRDVSLGEVEAELGRRFGISGLDEKASRNPQ